QVNGGQIQDGSRRRAPRAGGDLRSVVEFGGGVVCQVKINADLGPTPANEGNRAAGPHDRPAGAGLEVVRDIVGGSVHQQLDAPVVGRGVIRVLIEQDEI